MDFKNRVQFYANKFSPLPKPFREEDVYWHEHPHGNSPKSIRILARREKIFDLYYELIALSKKNLIGMKATSFHNTSKGEEFWLPSKEKNIFLSLLGDHKELLEMDPQTVVSTGNPQRWVALFGSKIISVFSRASFDEEYQLLKEQNISPTGKKREKEPGKSPDPEAYQRKFHEMVTNLGLIES